MSILSLALRRLQTYIPRSIHLGDYRVALPAGHPLDWARLRHRNYDEPIKDICSLLVKKYPDLCVIDIGANVGDTAALAMVTPRVSVLCIEGNASYLPFLKRNLKNISPNCEIEASYVGFVDGMVSASVTTKRGTAAINVDSNSGERVHLRNLGSILDDHPRFKNAHLLKIDTDGLDCKIIMAAADTIGRMRPVLHIEYSPAGSDAAEMECRVMIRQLCEIGYMHFHVFDNFGNHMLRLSGNETVHLHSLNAYLRSSLRDNMKPSVNYFDICAMTSDDSDVSDALLALYVKEDSAN